MAEQNPEFTSEELARYNELIEKGEETVDSSWEKFYEGVGFKVWRSPKEVCNVVEYFKTPRARTVCTSIAPLVPSIVLLNNTSLFIAI